VTYALSWVRAEGAEACPSARALVAEVERRLGRSVFDASADRSIEVEVTRFGDTYRSDVYVRDAAGKTSGHRELQSDEPGCGALVSATSLAIALVIDPEAASRPAPTAAAFEPPPAIAPPPAPAEVPPPPPPSVPAPPPSHDAPRVSAPPHTVVTISGRALLESGLVPKTSPGFELSVSSRPGRRWGYALAVALTPAQTATHGIGSLDIGLSRVSALVTFDAGHSDTARLLFGAGPSLGAFHVAVREPAPVTAPGDYWFAGATLGADLQVRVLEGVFIELGGFGFAPLRRQEFLVRGQSEAVWRQPIFSGLGFLGLGTTIP
jgi:hypothetical protein